jgi:putative addiction module component (TIGR02574 family)
MLGVGRSVLDVCFSVDYTFSVSTVEEIRTAIPKLSVEEKLQTMEALWQSLSSKPEALESPAWHEEQLRDRERDIESGKSKFIDWETAKADIRRQTS